MQQKSRLDSLLARRAQAKPTDTRSPKWSVEDQLLIDWILKHYNEADFPVLGKPVKQWIQLGLAQGPGGELATSGKFRNGLLYLKNIIEKLQPRY